MAPAAADPPPFIARRWPLRVPALGGAILLAAAVIGFGYYRSHTPAQAVGASARRSVAVLNFRNLTGRAEAQWLATAIPEILRADLAAGQTIRTIPGENVSRMESELSLHPVSSPSANTLKAVRRNLGADLVISARTPTWGRALETVANRYLGPGRWYWRGGRIGFGIRRRVRRDRCR